MDATAKAELLAMLWQWRNREYSGNDLGKVRRQEAEKHAKAIEQWLERRNP